MNEELEKVRKAFRHKAHIYAGTRNTKDNEANYLAAVADLERSAILYVTMLAASNYQPPTNR